MLESTPRTQTPQQRNFIHLQQQHHPPAIARLKPTGAHKPEAKQTGDKNHMVTKQIPQSIQASIHQDAINRVSQFFNATTSDILNELLQNARRSGASRVDVTTQDGRLTISDNGQGISDPAAILAFGQTAWDTQTELSERPAGMGLYALARCKLVTVRSKPENGDAWQVTLTPGHFTGQLSAPIERLPLDGTPKGTSVSFDRAQSDQSIESEVQAAAKHHPLPVYFNNNKLDQSDFLQGADHTQEWQGIRIGVYGNHNDLMNFHGIIVRHPSLPKIETIGRRVWTTKVDVMECPRLELTLPARREVVETPFMQELRQACRRTIYQAMTLQPEPVNVPKYMQEEAAAMGISLPDAAPKLEPWQPRRANSNYYEPNTEYRYVTDNTIALDLDLSAANQQALARAAGQNGTMDRLYKQNSYLAGYGWYDRLTKANKLRITVTDQDGNHELDETQQDQKKLQNQRPNQIVFTLENTPENHESPPVEIITLPSDLAFENDQCDSLYDATPLVTMDSTINVHELSDLMMEGFFDPSDDHDADSFNTQESDAQMECEGTAISLLSSKDDAVRASISNAMERYVVYEIPRGMTATIRASRGKLLEVTLEAEAPDPREDEEE